jgi:hypothetical protein
MKMTRRSATRLGLAFLVVSLFMERFTFIVSIHKVQDYSILLIFMVIGLTWFTNWIITKTARRNRRRRLAELFDFEQTPHISNAVIAIISTFDAIYMCLFFWPAKFLPTWILIAML